MNKFLRAFSRLCKDGYEIFLYIIDWGKDSDKAKKILDEPEIKDKVKIIPGPISREQVAHYMACSDILVEQFNSGSYTRIGIEAFLFGIPVLLNLDEKIHQEVHGSLPDIINAKTENEIYNKIKMILQNKNKLEEMANNTKKWAEEQFDLQKNVDTYIKIYESILKK